MSHTISKFVTFLLLVASPALLSSQAFAVSARQKPEANTSTVTSEENQKKPPVAQDTPPVAAPSTPMYDLSQGFSQVAEKALLAVVNVSTTQSLETSRDRLGPPTSLEELFRDFFEPDRGGMAMRPVQSLGSGFIVHTEKEGKDFVAYIVTNYHVIADAKQISVTLHDNTKLDGTLHGYDERTDIALLRVVTSSLSQDKQMLPTLKWGDSHTIKVGDWVLAIGNPFGLGSTVTSGIISNRSRDIALRGSMKNRASEYVDDYVQHDASINMGNSGGPLVNLKGEVIAINTAIVSPNGGNIGIGFGVPASVASNTVEQLRKFGRTRRGWLGIHIQNIDADMAESFGLSQVQGAIVSNVAPGSPAAKAGLERGDIVLFFDDKEINEKARLPRIVGETEVDKEVNIQFNRKGKVMKTKIKLGEYPSQVEDNKPGVTQERGAHTVDILGMKCKDLTEEVRRTYRISENIAKGVVITGKTSNASAELNHIYPGDVIIETNLTPIETTRQLKNIVETEKKNGKQNLTFLINRDGSNIYITLKIQ